MNKTTHILTIAGLMAFSGCERGTDGHKSDKLANDIRDGYAEVMARF